LNPNDGVPHGELEFNDNGPTEDGIPTKFQQPEGKALPHLEGYHELKVVLFSPQIPSS